MADLDLTDAVDAAARALFAQTVQRHGVSLSVVTFDDLPDLDKHAIRETVLPVVAAAAPSIERAALLNAGIVP